MRMPPIAPPLTAGIFFGIYGCLALFRGKQLVRFLQRLPAILSKAALLPFVIRGIDPNSEVALFYIRPGGLFCCAMAAVSIGSYVLSLLPHAKH